MTTKASLGDRMKRYEHAYRSVVMPRSYTIIRVDGRAFHTFTKGCDRPFDKDLQNAMCSTMMSLCEEVAGCKFGYQQSDEINLVLTDFDSYTTEPWLGGSVQKLTSISASIATAAFNSCYTHPLGRHATFDSRVFSLPNEDEVINYFIWRQRDAIKNFVSSLARIHFSHSKLHKKNTGDLQEMLFNEKGIDVDALPINQQRGCAAIKREDSRGYKNWYLDLKMPKISQEKTYISDCLPM